MTLTEANEFIKATLNKWHYGDLKVEWIPNRRRVLGLYQFGKSGVRVLLTPRILNKSELFREVFLHELAHALDHRERGSFLINTRNSHHGANWRKWCERLGIPARRFINL